MPGSDRLEEASASETTEVEAVKPEATEPAKVAPKRSPKAKRVVASATTEVEAVKPEAVTGDATVPPRINRVPRLLERYRSQVKEAMQQEFGYLNVMQIPHLEKVVLNIGLGESKTNPKAMENATRDLGLIAAQKPVITRARRSIAGFKLREGDPIGTAVTLRGNRMYEFMDRLLNAALPRIRDFRGVSRKAFDGRGNYSLGIREQVVFPEIDYGQIDRIRSLQVAIITTAATDQEAMRLLDLLGMPFTRETVVASESVKS
jgi:large subunit ribosomal protein L5